MKIRAIAFDVDGTLFDYRDQKIHQSTIEAIHAAHGRGVQIVLATARSYAELNAECQRKIGADYFIGASGHSILDGAGRSIYTERFGLEQTERMIRLAKQYDIGLTLKYDYVNCLYAHFDEMQAVYGNIGNGIMETLRCGTQDYHLKELPIGFSIRGENGKRDLIARELLRYPLDYRLELFKNGVVADVFLPGVSKLTAMRCLCGRLGIGSDAVMSFGDSLNDIEMTKWAGMGVAMGNGREELKRHADYVCGASWEDGIAHAIERFVL